MQYDVAVIGGGPGGYVAAIRAARAGRKTVLFEKGTVGGVCLNEGCIPTKAFIRSAHLLQECREAGALGVTGVDPSAVGVDMPALQARKKRVVNQLTGGVAALLRKNGVAVVKGAAAFVDPHTLRAAGETVTATNIIIASGSRPVVPKTIEIDRDATFLTSREALELTSVPRTVGLIGGGVIGLEFAYILAVFGAQVQVFEALEEVLPGADADMAKIARQSLEKVGVTFHTGVTVRRVTRNGLEYTKKGIRKDYPCEAVLMAVGRAPDASGLELEKAGVRTERGAVVTDLCLRTSVPHIFAIGDVNGKCMLAHTAFHEAEVAVEVICGRRREMNYGIIPSCVFTNPEIAWLGLTEQQARERGLDYTVGRFPLAANGRALVQGETGGMVKIVVEKRTGEIFGAHLAAPNAGELISELSLGMTLEATPEEFAAAVHPHPTISECIAEAMADTRGAAVHK